MVLSQDDKKAKAVGINHIALEVGNIDEALEFYSSFIDFEISRRSETAAFVYFGDQFINFILGRNQGPDERRHFGIAVDDKELARETLENMGIKFLDGQFLDFLDPLGQPSRNYDIHQYSVHQGRSRFERHGSPTFVQN